ncbi:MAG: hypothetical protein GY909_07320 [Oligoflexia bacterium]|nr:hypothetical protein [Oligoflexia bacterium]
MKKISSITLLTTILLFSGCGQSFNSNSLDRNLAQVNNCADPSYTELCAANQIIQAQCIDCHDRFHDTWTAFDTDQKWIDSGRVIKNDADRSPLIVKLKKYGGNMPKDKDPLSTADINALRTWINNMP